MQFDPESEIQTGSRRMQAVWLGLMAVAFLAVSIVAELLSHWLKLPMLPGAALLQAGILLVGLTFAWADGGGIRRLGLRGEWKGYDAAVIPGLIAINVAGSAITTILLQGTGAMDMEGQPITSVLRDLTRYEPGEFLLIAAALMLLVGLAEELLFRGYIITRLERLGLSMWPCILISALIFGLIHLPGYNFAASVSKAVWFGIPTAFYFWHRRNLGPLVIAHALMNYMGFVLVYFMLKFFPNLPMF